MKSTKTYVAATAAGLTLASLVLAGCTDTDAAVGSKNLATAAEQFELNRRVVFINGITNEYLFTIEGFCSIEDADKQLEVTCKAAGGELKKHILGLSDNVTYIVEQLEGVGVSTDHYRVIFKPEVIVPDVDRP